jgi:hypothetical protein
MMTGHKSAFDNDFYLSVTYPPPIDGTSVLLSATQRASMAIMHVFIQCPHAICLIRDAISNPENASALAAAMSHMEYLIQVNLSQHVSGLLQEAVTVVPIPPSPDITDIMPDSIEFESVQSMILCTRYWMLQNVLCGLADTIYRHFPAEAALSLLTSPERLRTVDIDSALHLAKSIRWANSISQELPLVSLRLHTPLQISIGPWYRTIREARTPGLRATISDADLSRAQRMKAWIIHQCNLIHMQWDVSLVDEKAMLECIDCMAGEQRPDWLPSRVRFEAEDGEMVMKLDYEHRAGNYIEQYDLGEQPPRIRGSQRTIETAQFWEPGDMQDLTLRPTHTDTRLAACSPSPGNAYNDGVVDPSWKTRPADFLHGTGRNLCSISGWWSETSSTTTMPLGGTHLISEVPHMNQQAALAEGDGHFGDMASHPCLASSWSRQTPNALSASSSGTSRHSSTTPAHSGSTTITFGNGEKNACFSPAWINEG